MSGMPGMSWMSIPVVRLVSEAKKILTANKLDKLMYIHKDGVQDPSIRDIVQKYSKRFERLLKQLNFMVDTVLINKLNEFKERGIRPLPDILNYLEREYRATLIPILDFVISLYGPTVQHNGVHDCPHRWYSLNDKSRPCVEYDQALQTLVLLNNVTGTNMTPPFSKPDCVSNFYTLLDIIKLSPLPRCTTLSELAPIIDALILVKDTSVRAEGRRDEQLFNARKRDIIYGFNSLCPKDAYIFSTRQPNWQDNTSRGWNLGTLYNKIIRDGKGLSGTDTYGNPIKLDLPNFYAKVNAYKPSGLRGGSRNRRTRRLRS